jgi:hypothetical protein
MAKTAHNEAPKTVCRPELGKLPPALLNPNSVMMQRAFSAVDNIESGIRDGDGQAIHCAQREVAKVVSHVRQKLCKAYRYPDPDPENPLVWQVVCTSGLLGNFLAAPEACMECSLFNQDYMPMPSAVPVRTIQQVLAMEAARQS